MQKSLLLDVKQRNNRKLVKHKMEKTFALRRHEVVRDAPMVESFMAKGPAPFYFSEINAEFERITTVPLQSKFLSQLDLHSDILIKLFQKRGGQLGRTLKRLLHKYLIVTSQMLDASVSSKDSVSTWGKIQRTLCRNMWTWMKMPSKRSFKTPPLECMSLNDLLLRNQRTLGLSLKESACCRIWKM